MDKDEIKKDLKNHLEGKGGDPKFKSDLLMMAMLFSVIDILIDKGLITKEEFAFRMIKEMRNMKKQAVDFKEVVKEVLEEKDD